MCLRGYRAYRGPSWLLYTFGPHHRKIKQSCPCSSLYLQLPVNNISRQYAGAQMTERLLLTHYGQLWTPFPKLVGVDRVLRYSYSCTGRSIHNGELSTECESLIRTRPELLDYLTNPGTAIQPELFRTSVGVLLHHGAITLSSHNSSNKRTLW